MPFEIVQNDIVNMQVDAVVNTASCAPLVGSGVDCAIHKKSGPSLLAARQGIGRIEPGDAAITPGFGLAARYVIHTAGPIWEGGGCNEEHLLASCYRRSLELAGKYNCETVAFPLISTGNYGFPKALALQIAVREIGAFLLENEMMVYLVVFEKEAFELSERLFRSVSSYIDENYISDKILDEYCTPRLNNVNVERGYARGALSKSLARNKELLPPPAMYSCADASVGAAAPVGGNDLGELLQRLDAGFSETLLQLIDRSGKKDSEIYKKANVDRKLFSKIRNNVDYKPSKATALAFAFALELDIDEARDFIARAGYALSHSNKFDVIVEYFLVNRSYDIFELNEVLFAFDQPLIGA